VLVYGGKTSEGGVSGQFLLWREQAGWQVVEATGPAPLSRFGASLVTTDSRSGVVFGGMDNRGTVLRDFWSWSLIQSEDGVILIELVNKTEYIADGTLLMLGRFGASISTTREHTVVIGGISTKGCLSHEHEVLLLGKHSLRRLVTETGSQLSVTPVSAAPSEPRRPLLIGHSSSAVDDGQNILIVGGGAVCFSFGTYWNEGSWLLKAPTAEQINEWVLVEPSATTADLTISTPSTEAVQAASIPRVKISSPEEFQAILAAAKPVILEGLDIGPCVSLWTKEYLQENVGQEREVNILLIAPFESRDVC
jgi:tRNA wybutosine-synthesizing protein 4